VSCAADAPKEWRVRQEKNTIPASLDFAVQSTKSSTPAAIPSTVSPGELSILDRRKSCNF
jgi:hypothetical protein